jgi:hypothetical protein
MSETEVNVAEVIKILKMKYGLRPDTPLEKLLKILAKKDREQLLPYLKQEPMYKKLIIEYLREEKNK